MEERTRIRPFFFTTILGAKARIVFAVPFRLLSITSRQSASSISKRGFQRWIAALATTMSILPNCCSVRSAIFRSADVADVGADGLDASAERPDHLRRLLQFFWRGRGRIGCGR